MKIVKGSGNRYYFHAHCRFKEIEKEDYLYAFVDLCIAKLLRVASVTFHLPYEIQFPTYRNETRGNRYMDFVDRLSRRLGVLVLWENTNLLNSQDWSLLENPAWVPDDRLLCFDLGHAVLGAHSKGHALQILDSFFQKHSRQIKHLHLHINDFRHDYHWNYKDAVITFLGEKRFKRIITNRSFIFEPSS